jgi:hypothetical protein
MVDKHSTSFSSTRSIAEIRSSCWMGFLGQRGAVGRAIGEEDDPGRDFEIRSVGADDGAIDAGLSRTEWTISPSSLALMT